MASGTYIRFVAAQSESGKIHVTVRMGDSAGSTVAAVVIAGFPTTAVVNEPRSAPERTRKYGSQAINTLGRQQWLDRPVTGLNTS